MTTAPNKPAKHPGPGIVFRREGSFIYVSGTIDEFAEYSALLSTKPPLKLVLREVSNINSIGTLRWAQFIDAYGHQTLEFHECPPVFLDAATMVPRMISKVGNMKRIKSFLTEMRCEPCNRREQIVIGVNQITDGEEGPTAPTAHCPKCKQALTFDDDLEDYLLFLVNQRDE